MLRPLPVARWCCALLGYPRLSCIRALPRYCFASSVFHIFVNSFIPLDLISCYIFLKVYTACQRMNYTKLVPEPVVLFDKRPLPEGVPKHVIVPEKKCELSLFLQRSTFYLRSLPLSHRISGPLPV